MLGFRTSVPSPFSKAPKEGVPKLGPCLQDMNKMVPALTQLGMRHVPSMHQKGAEAGAGF